MSGSLSTVIGLLYSHNCYRLVLCMNTSKVHAAPLIKSHNLQIVISYIHTWQPFSMCHQELTAELVYNLFSPVATSSLSSTLDGRQAACHGELVTYTCNVTQGFLIGWGATPVLDAALVQFACSHRFEDTGMQKCHSIQCDDSEHVTCSVLYTKHIHC